MRLSNSKGEVVYLRTCDFSTLAVATGSETVTAEIEVPSTLAAGAWSMTVVANGIASDAVDVEVALQDCYLILDRDTFGEGEIQAMVNLGGAPVEINPALYVVVEGYSAERHRPDGGQSRKPTSQARNRRTDHRHLGELHRLGDARGPLAAGNGHPALHVPVRAHVLGHRRVRDRTRVADPDRDLQSPEPARMWKATASST